MMTRKKRNLILIVSIVTSVIVVILVAICVFLYLKTDKFKSNETLFFKYFGKGIENIKSIQSINFAEDNGENYSSSAEANVKYTTNLGTTSEDTSNNINQLKLKIDGQTDKTSNYKYKKIQLQNGENTEATVETLQNDNTSGVKFSDLFGQYVVNSNSDINSLIEKLGISDSIGILDYINLENINIDDIKFTEEEVDNLKEKYTTIISKNLSSSSFSKQTNTTVKINNKNYAANAYVLNLTKEQLNNLYVKILEQVKQDDVILGKIDKIQEKIESTNKNSNMQLKEKFVAKIENTIQKINSNNIGSDSVKIVVYENQKQTIRISIQTADYEINIDYTELDNEKYFNIEKTVNDKTVAEIAIDYTQEKATLELENNNDDNAIKIVFERNTKEQDNQKNNNYVLKYEDNMQRAELGIKQNIKLNDVKDKTNFNDENSVNLSNISEDQSKQVIEKVQTAVKEKSNQVKQNIKFDDIRTMLENIGILSSDTKLSSQGVTDAELNRYNSKYELLQGEKLESAKVLTMIETIKDNISNINIVSGQELKLEINENQGNQQVVEALENYFDKNKNNQYNIKVEYDENKFVKNIDLTIVPKE